MHMQDTSANHSYSYCLDLIPRNVNNNMTINNENNPKINLDRPTLKVGDNNESVIELEQILRELKYLMKNPDRFFGLDTKEAVQKFQTNYHLIADGIVDSKTWKKLFQILEMPVTINRPVIKLGNKNKYVKELQLKLAKLGYFDGETHSVFDIKTDEAVKEFQKIHNLPIDGIVNHETWDAINRLFFASGSFPLSINEPIVQGATGEDVKILQRGLRALNYYYGSITGNFDSNTTKAVREFQTINKLPVTGNVDLVTWELLVYKFLYLEGIEGAEVESVELTEGSSGMNVAILQETLKIINYFPDMITGNYGPETTRAVREFQTTHNLPVNGNVDATTWQVILSEAEKVTEGTDEEPNRVNSSKPRVTLGDRGQAVSKLQALLTSLLYYKDPIHGVFDSTTSTAVRIFQINNNLNVDGIVGPKTWETMMQLHLLLERTNNENFIMPITQEEDKEPPYVNYLVATGDTLWSIAQKFHSSIEELMYLNGLTTSNIVVGQQLVVPKLVSMPYMMYAIATKDSLWSIANKYHTTVEELKKINNLTSDLLFIGQQIKIPRI